MDFRSDRLSRTLRDQFKVGLGKKPEILLLDEELETEAILDRFLDLIVYGEVGMMKLESLDDVRPWLLVLDLLDKYLCDQHYETLTFLAMSSMLRGVLPEIWAFVLGAHANDEELCALALKTESARAASMSVAGQVEFGMAAPRCTDLMTMTYELWNILPRDYSKALNMAWARHKVMAAEAAAGQLKPVLRPAHGTGDQGVDISDQFRSYLDLIRREWEYEDWVIGVQPPRNLKRPHSHESAEE